MNPSINGTILSGVFFANKQLSVCVCVCKCRCGRECVQPSIHYLHLYTRHKFARTHTHNLICLFDCSDTLFIAKWSPSHRIKLNVFISQFVCVPIWTLTRIRGERGWTFDQQRSKWYNEKGEHLRKGVIIRFCVRACKKKHVLHWNMNNEEKKINEQTKINDKMTRAPQRTAQWWDDVVKMVFYHTFKLNLQTIRIWRLHYYFFFFVGNISVYNHLLVYYSIWIGSLGAGAICRELQLNGKNMKA